MEDKNEAAIFFRKTYSLVKLMYEIVMSLKIQVFDQLDASKKYGYQPIATWWTLVYVFYTAGLTFTNMV